MSNLLRRQEIAAFCALALAFVFVFVDQAPDRSLQKGHRGWCSANVLGIIERATPSNGFVGYTLEYVDPDGRHDYEYFDRYPVFFSAAMHVVLNTFELSRGTKIYVARQAMNVLYVLSLLFAVAFLMELEIPPGLAVAATALAGSGKLLVYYRDMIHFDQAALLGFMGLLWAIARWYRVRDNRFIYIATAIAVVMGRGYASFAVLGTWWIVEAVRAVRADFRRAPKQVVWSVQSRACLLAIAVAGSCLGYNIWTEARKRDVPVAEVGIVLTAIKRLTLNPDFNKSKARRLAWAPFSEKIAARGVKNLQPNVVPGLVAKKGPVLFMEVAMVAIAIGLFVVSRKAPLRPPLIVASLAGLAWIFPMRGLTAFHEFTTMFLLSLSVVFMAALVRFVPTRIQLLPALLACACLVFSTHQRNDQLRAHEAAGEVVTHDLQRIEAKLKPGETIEVDPNARKLVPGVPYALGFFLANQPIVKEGRGQFLVTKKKKKHQASLTPDNDRIFLYRRD